MDESLRAHIDGYLLQIETLVRHGCELSATLATDSGNESTLVETRIWQQDCAALVNQLSGGVKAHWLSRAYSGALLVRSAAGDIVVEARVADIIDRILDVLGQAARSLSRMDEDEAVSSKAMPPTRRFEFVHNVELRPILEQAYADSRRALEEGRFGPALITSCGILEAIITDAVEAGGGRLPPSREGSADRRGLGGGGQADPIADWSFETRIAAAERAGLIRGGCARLPPVARRYRDLTDAEAELRQDADVSERDARLARQVLRVVMRDLDPGR